MDTVNSEVSKGGDRLVLWRDEGVNVDCFDEALPLSRRGGIYQYWGKELLCGILFFRGYWTGYVFGGGGGERHSIRRLIVR